MRDMQPRPLIPIQRSMLTSSVFAGLVSLCLIAPIAGASAPQEPVPAPTPAPAPAPEVVFSSSLWQKKAESVAGSYRIEAVQSADGSSSHRLILSSDFATAKGPDLKVVLSPVSADKVNGKSALTGSVVLGVLSKSKGQSSFKVPIGTRFSQFNSVLIHCEEYTKLWAAAPLLPGKLLASGSKWTKKAEKISGRWEISEHKNKRFIRLGSDFKTKSAPDLKFVFSPLKIAEVTSKTALNEAKIVAPLRSVKGRQEYRIPPGIELKKYKSLLIHCEQYTKLWGGVELRR